ncbi:MAG: hypothetical protein J5733_02045 [Bacteroidaceae bacterium]|nr:hypothetical protein [Bacteroidaceae bacterium]
MRKILLSILLLLMAGVQIAQAQAVILKLSDNRTVIYGVEEVDSILFSSEMNYAGGYEYVDLDLPSGTLWATCNVGASSPENHGDYFAWGETETKELFDWSTYKLLNEEETSWTQINKYTIADSQTEGCWYNGTSFIGDNRTRLLPADDAATANWGSQWKMPSKAQFEELINSDYTTTEWTTLKGVEGYKITSKNNNKSIFLPAAGEYYGSYLDESLGAYWSSELSSDHTNRATYLSFKSNNIYLTSFNRTLGHSIRPVRSLPESVDLGLPSGTLWATYNIGASSPDDFGTSFAWGETEPYEHHFSVKYKYYSDGKYTKYNNEDGLTELLEEDDAATVNWGSKWQTPSWTQFAELFNKDYTTKTISEIDGTIGCKITSNLNGNSIFLPATGYDYKEGSYGSYWSRSLDTDDSSCEQAIYLFFDVDDSSYVTPYILRTTGLPVRPVRKK